MTAFECFKEFIKERFGFTHCDMGYTHDGMPWVSFANSETYTFFTFSKEGNFEEIVTRQFSDHAIVETPVAMRKLDQLFQEALSELL